MKYVLRYAIQYKSANNAYVSVLSTPITRIIRIIRSSRAMPDVAD
jgi:hypothetical protein